MLSLESLAATDELVDVTVKANFKTLGARFGKTTQEIAAQIANEDPRDLVAALRNGPTKITALGTEYDISSQDIVITEVPREGWTVASDAGESLALDLALTPELIGQGIARDVTRLIQDARKSSGFEISDRISVTWKAGAAATVDALNSHQGLICAEVLATSWQQGEVASPTATDEELDLKVFIAKA